MSKFCASCYHFSSIQNHLTLLHFPSISLMGSASSQQGTAQVTTIFVSPWLPIKETTLPGLLPLSGQSLARSAFIEPEKLTKLQVDVGGEQRQIVARIGKG